ncbi:type 1 glutamine amidotransferase domain-containing protein [Entomomonas asaccharolytica]|uniref:Type 1 glutamine amidotransferase domain-containing protein n=1 Tax=Entomomonas asaccharolytica TaxID=2785331 RepID=A0A974NFA1_9GAMM|nr:type 1 glutamine amidotransferase domain-containing protein [Entomomonas asaccharolytica]QQP85695.1 type 1 glutamine amidotransferase domain-containing protein [Entomomonas asaccharolytica]
MLETIKVLIIVTSHAMMGNTGEPTGLWLEELTTPYYVLSDAGVQVEIVSIEGGKVPIDPRSMQADGKNPASVERFLKDKAAMQQIESSKKLDSVELDGYSAVFMPGGHGTMWDLPESKQLANLLTEAWQQDIVIAAVCHGPAGLVNVKDTNGKPLVAGRRVSAFTNTEEEGVGLKEKVPFLLETRIKELGANYEKGPDFKPFAVRDGNLITGQNPASSEKVAELIVETIKEK